MHFVHIVTAKNKQYYYNSIRNEPIGPLTIDEIRGLVQLGRIAQHTWVIEKNGHEWKKLSDLFPDIFSPNPRTQSSSFRMPIPEPQSQQKEIPVSTIPQPPFVSAETHRSEEIAKAAKIASSPIVLSEPKPVVAPVSVEKKKIISPSFVARINNVELERKIRKIYIANLISGISNLIFGCAWLTLGSVFSIVNFAFSLPPACYCLLTGIFEISNAAKCKNSPQQRISIRHARIFALLSIFSIFCGNIISSILGLRNFAYYRDKNIQNFFE